MLIVIMTVGIVAVVFLTSARSKDPIKQLQVNIGCFTFSIIIYGWLFWTTLRDGQKLLPILAVVIILLSAWRIVQAISKLRALKQS